LAEGGRRLFREPFGELSELAAAESYDQRVKQIPCVCGQVVRGDDDEELWQNAQEHMREDHPELVGKVSRADLLAQAEEIPKPL
jgi:hypothetical protein